MYMIVDYFDYVKFDGDVHIFCFKPFFARFVRKIYLAFWYYLISFPAVYSQRLEASGFSCLFLAFLLLMK